MVEITFKVGDIDYDKTIDKFLPDIMKILQEGEGTNIIVRKAVSAKPELAMNLIKGVVSAMSQSQKDALTVKFLNMKAADICRKLNQYTSTSGLDLVLTDAVAFKKKIQRRNDHEQAHTEAQRGRRKGHLEPRRYFCKRRALAQ